MKLLITGHAGHGKDTACDILKKEFGLSFVSSSFFVAEKAVRPYLAERGLTYPTLALCYLDRVNHRALWKKAIKAYNTPDLARMTRELFSEHQIYCGLRDRDEFMAAKAEYLFEVSIWIDALKRLPPEDISSMEIKPEDCDFIVDNNGPLEELAPTMIDLYRFLQPTL